jgi:hypothetical protein
MVVIYSIIYVKASSLLIPVHDEGMSIIRCRSMIII